MFPPPSPGKLSLFVCFLFGTEVQFAEPPSRISNKRPLVFDVGQGGLLISTHGVFLQLIPVLVAVTASLPSHKIPALSIHNPSLTLIVSHHTRKGTLCLVPPPLRLLGVRIQPRCRPTLEPLSLLILLQSRGWGHLFNHIPRNAQGQNPVGSLETYHQQMTQTWRCNSQRHLHGSLHICGDLPLSSLPERSSRNKD